MTLEKNKKVRESGVELLRIFLMIQVIILHIYDYGNFKEVYSEMNGGVLKRTAQVVYALCRTPIPCFILISGYFMINNNMDTIKKSYKRLWGFYKQVWAYSVLIMVAALIISVYGYKDLFATETNEYGVWRAFFPMMGRCWYFISAYILVCLFAPFVNSVVEKLSKKHYRLLLLLMILVFSVWPLLSKMRPFSKVVSSYKVVEAFYGKSFGCFLMMYLIGGYL